MDFRLTFCALLVHLFGTSAKAQTFYYADTPTVPTTTTAQPMLPPKTIMEWLPQNTHFFGSFYRHEVERVTAWLQMLDDPVAFDAFQNITQLTNLRCVWRLVIDTLADDRNIFGLLAKNTRINGQWYNLQNNQNLRYRLPSIDEVFDVRHSSEGMWAALVVNFINAYRSSETYYDRRVFIEKLSQYCLGSDVNRLEKAVDTLHRRQHQRQIELQNNNNNNNNNNNYYYYG